MGKNTRMKKKEITSFVNDTLINFTYYKNKHNWILVQSISKNNSGLIKTANDKGMP
jgi:hypothetical protein